MIPDGLSTVPGDTLDKRTNYLIYNTEIIPYVANLTGVDLDAATEELFIDVTDLGSYNFNFVFKDNIDEYELRVMADGRVATDSVTMAKADYSWLDTGVKIYKEDEHTVSGEILINNHADVDGLTYKLCLIFYDVNNNIIGVSASDTKDIEDTITSDNHSAVLPAGTVRVKAVAWSSYTKMIPLCKYDLASKN